MGLCCPGQVRQQGGREGGERREGRGGRGEGGREVDVLTPPRLPRSLQHIQALSVYSAHNAPGEKPKLLKVHEQRLTNVAVHMLIREYCHPSPHTPHRPPFTSTLPVHHSHTSLLTPHPHSLTSTPHSAHPAGPQPPGTHPHRRGTGRVPLPNLRLAQWRADGQESQAPHHAPQTPPRHLLRQEGRHTPLRMAARWSREQLQM